MPHQNAEPPSRRGRPHIPDDRERQGRIYVYEQRRHLVRVVEDEAVSPGDDGAREGAVREAVARHKERGVAWEEPYVDKVEDRAVVAEVKEEVVPRALFVGVRPHGEQVPCLQGVRDVHPSGAGQSGREEARSGEPRGRYALRVHSEDKGGEEEGHDAEHEGDLFARADDFGRLP